MNVSVHFWTSIVLTVILYPFIGFYSLWAMVGGWLIDFDHWLWTMYRLKSFSLQRSYDYHYERHHDANYEKDILHAFHTVEFWAFMVIVAVLAYLTNYTFIFYMFAITLLGMFMHVSLDVYSQLKKSATDSRAFSFIGWTRRNL